MCTNTYQIILHITLVKFKVDFYLCSILFELLCNTCDRLSLFFITRYWFSLYIACLLVHTFKTRYCSHDYMHSGKHKYLRCILWLGYLNTYVRRYTRMYCQQVHTITTNYMDRVVNAVMPRTCMVISGIALYAI